MSAIDSVILEVQDTAAAGLFYKSLGVEHAVRVRAAETDTSGFRGFTISIVVAQPNTADSFLRGATDAGATTLKPARKSFWGYGGVVQAPDGAIWKVATSNKKDKGPATRDIDALALLLGVEDVKATKQFYIDQGLVVGKSFGSKYVEFESTGSPIKLALYGRRALAKDAGVPPEGTGSHRIVVSGDLGTFTDPDGFRWESA
jgi:uncharacterized glyoxalase superfamily protein PhnB